MTALAKTDVALQYNGFEIGYDSDRMVDLTAMWKAAGSDPSKAPNRWLKLPQAVEFIASLAGSDKGRKSPFIKSRRGKGVAGTFAHYQVAMAYAKYLSPEFHRFVNEAFKEWAEEKVNPGLKAERAVEGYRRQGKSAAWIQRRLKGISARTALLDTMGEHGCQETPRENPFAEASTAMNLAVLGRTARELKAAKGLPGTAPTRDHLDEVKLVALELTETMARTTIVAEGAQGNAECVAACRRAGKAVKLALDSMAAPVCPQ